MANAWTQYCASCTFGELLRLPSVVQQESATAGYVDSLQLRRCGYMCASEVSKPSAEFVLASAHSARTHCTTLFEIEYTRKCRDTTLDQERRCRALVRRTLPYTPIISAVTVHFLPFFFFLPPAVCCDFASPTTADFSSFECTAGAVTCSMTTSSCLSVSACATISSVHCPPHHCKRSDHTFLLLW